MNEQSSQRHSLRPLNKDDLPDILEWRNHPDIRRYMFSQHKISEWEHLNWYEVYSMDETKDALIFEVNEVATGFMQFNSDRLNNCADWGFYMAPTAARGFGVAMGRLGLEYAFVQLGLNKLSGQAIAFNNSSIKFHLSLGFTQEGLRREQYRSDEKYYDVAMFGLLKADWQRKCDVKKVVQ